MSPSTGNGVAGPTGLRALEDRKQDKGSATIHSLRKEAGPVQAPLQKRSTVRGGSSPDWWAIASSGPHRFSRLPTHRLPPRAATTKGNASVLQRFWFVWCMLISIKSGLSQTLSPCKVKHHRKPTSACSARILPSYGLGARNYLGHHVVAKVHSRCLIMK